MIARILTRWHPLVWSTPDNSPRTITGKPAAIRSAADLDALIASRKALSSGHKGARTKRAMAHLVERLEGHGG